MEGVLLFAVCSLSSSAAAFLLGNTYSAADAWLFRPTSLKRIFCPTFSWLHNLWDLIKVWQQVQWGLTPVVAGGNRSPVPRAVHVLVPHPVMLLSRHPALAQLAECTLRCGTLSQASACTWQALFDMPSLLIHVRNACSWVVKQAPVSVHIDNSLSDQGCTPARCR